MNKDVVNSQCSIECSAAQAEDMVMRSIYASSSRNCGEIRIGTFREKYAGRLEHAALRTRKNVWKDKLPDHGTPLGPGSAAENVTAVGRFVGHYNSPQVTSARSLGIVP